MLAWRAIRRQRFKTRARALTSVAASGGAVERKGTVGSEDWSRRLALVCGVKIVPKMLAKVQGSRPSPQPRHQATLQDHAEVVSYRANRVSCGKPT